MQRQIRNLTLAAMLLALGLILPLVTGNIPRVGNMLLPMHLPVFSADCCSAGSTD